MAFRDVREFIAALDKTGDVVHIKQEVDWELEAGAIARRAGETRSPAPFFEKIKDYPEGYRIFASPLAHYRRLAIAMGLPPEASIKDMQAAYQRGTEHPIKPVIVKDGPCKENIVKGDDVDLFQFPVPLVHGGDGGRYIGTWNMCISKDPDSDWVNWGMYRLMVYNKRHAAGLVLPYAHMGIVFRQKYQTKNKTMPVAIAIGTEPICSFTALTPFPQGASEVDYAGGLRGEPVELIKCETNDLLVPAHCEIILEGELIPNVTVREGPFGEFTGYRTPFDQNTVYRVNAITYRNNPILTMTCTGIPYYEGTLAKPITLGLELKRHLIEHGVPVTDVYIPPEGVNHLAIVGVKAQYAGVATQVEKIVNAWGQPIPKVIVVQDDIDVFNIAEVLHAFATKCHPVHGIRVIQYERANPLTPFLTLDEKRWRKGAHALFDCTWPVDWSKETEVPPRMSFKEAYPEEIKDKVLRDWKKYGYK